MLSGRWTSLDNAGRVFYGRGKSRTRQGHRRRPSLGLKSRHPTGDGALPRATLPCFETAINCSNRRCCACMVQSGVFWETGKRRGGGTTLRICYVCRQTGLELSHPTSPTSMRNPAAVGSAARTAEMNASSRDAVATPTLLTVTTWRY